MNTKKDRVSVNGKPISITTKSYIFALNKPKGYICSNKATDETISGGRLVVDLFDPWMKDWARSNPDKFKLPPRWADLDRLLEPKGLPPNSATCCAAGCSRSGGWTSTRPA